jgi:hypothetical protein
MNQGAGGDDLGQNQAGCPAGGNTPGCVGIRDTTVWLRHSQLGMVKIGHGSTATDNLILIDLGGMSGASTSDVALYNGGFAIPRNGVYDNFNRTWGVAINGGVSFDTARRNHILYETPALAGFTVQAAVGEDNFWDVALRYAGEFSGFRLAFGIGYQEDTEFNTPTQTTTGVTLTQSINCTTDCNRKETELKGSASLLHVSSGLFVTGAAARREVKDAISLVGGADNEDHTESFWYLAGGIRKNWFGYGDTVLFGEYSEHNDFLRRNVNFNNVVDSKATVWGAGIVQYIDAAAMELFLTYKHYSLDETLSGGTPFTGQEDFSTVIGGTRISF